MSEKLIVLHCSPTLAGMKTGSMFSCHCSSYEELLKDIRSLNQRLVPKGLRVIPLRYSKNKGLIYVFRPKELKRDLADQTASALLRERGYRSAEMESCICRLIRRFQTNEEFPHEVGLFLGYPPEDVCGFIQNQAGGHKCVGNWKVYGDEAAARKTFDKYKKCTKIYCCQWEQGKSIERLTVAG